MMQERPLSQAFAIVIAAMAFFAMCFHGFMVAFRAIGITHRRHDWVQPYLTDWVIYSFLIFVAATILAITLRPKDPKFVTISELHERAWKKDAKGKPLTEAEALCLDAMGINNYFVGGGIVSGIGNWGSKNVRKALPSLDTLDLTRAKEILTEAVDFFEWSEVNDDKFYESEQIAYFEHCEAYEQKLREAGLQEIPTRLGVWLKSQNR